MANITQRLLKINGTDIANICDYEIEYNKLWKDSDRNMAGEVRATLIGIFPKIKVKTTVQDISKVITVGNLVNNAYFTVQYFDILTNSVQTAQYYASDFSAKLLYRKNSLIDACSFNLIPVGKRVVND